MDLEKKPATPNGDNKIQDAAPAIGKVTTTSSDGMKPQPEPTSDPLDPLNWSKTRKHSILAIVMALYFMFTAITTITVPSFPGLQEQYNASLGEINWTVAIPALGLAVGPLIWSSPADAIGRRPIFLLGTLVAFAATLGAARAPTYGGYMAARFFQGLGVSPAATVGLAIINDCFFEHERGQKVGLWVLAIDMGLLVGPLLGGFINLAGKAWIQWVTAMLFGVIFVAELVFLPETLYPRSSMLHNTAAAVVSTDSTNEKPAGTLEAPAPMAVDMKRTKTLPFLNLKPVPQITPPKPWDSLLRFGKTWAFLPVPIAVFSYCFCWYWWILSIITMIPAAYSNYSPQIQGLLFLGLILGTLFSELLCSGTLSDKIVSRLARKRGGARVAEMRLWLAYPAALLSAVGLIVWGISIDKSYHWMVGQVAFFLFAAGLQMGNTVVCSYIVDCYPLQSMSMIVFYSVLLNGSAFVNPFFIAPWQATSGYSWTFAVQGIITFFGGGIPLAFLQWKGGALRAKCGIPSWVNPEYEKMS